MAKKFSLDNYNYNAPQELSRKAGQGLTSREKSDLFSARSTATVLDILKGKRSAKAKMASTGLSGGFADKAMDGFDVEASLSLGSIESGVEEESLRQQEQAMSEVRSLEFQWKQSMMNKDLTLYQISKQEEMNQKRIDAENYQNILSIIF